MNILIHLRRLLFQTMAESASQHDSIKLEEGRDIISCLQTDIKVKYFWSREGQTHSLNIYDT